MLDAILGEAPVVRNYQRFFRLLQPTVAWREHIPPGIRLQRVDRDLLGEASLGNVERLRGFVQGTYASAEAFLERGLGMCVIHAGHIASWCTTDCEVAAHSRATAGSLTVVPSARDAGTGAGIPANFDSDRCPIGADE